MRLHWLQHVPFEDLGHIEEWAGKQGFDISRTRLFEEKDMLPQLDTFDWLVVMGGPMGIFDIDEHPWLAAEKEFINRAIDADKIVIGICLGAQLMADVLGAGVFPGPQKEIGWFPVRRAEDGPDWFPETLTVFHWHGDTFTIPAGAVRLAVSEPGINQGFVYNDRAVALQFHMETTSAGMDALIKNCGHELVDAPYIQTAEQMHAGSSHVEGVNRTLERLLDSLALM